MSQFCRSVKDEISGEVSKCNPMTGDQYEEVTKHQEHQAKDNAQLCTLQKTTRMIAKDKVERKKFL